MNLIQARTTGDLKSCFSRLRELHVLALSYAKGLGGGSFPHSPEGGVASVTKLVESQHGVKPNMFVCPASGREPAEIVNGRFRVDEEHCSYEFVPWKLGLDDPSDAVLLLERERVHHGGRHVVHLDGAVEYLLEPDFQARLEKDRQRFGGSK